MREKILALLNAIDQDIVDGRLFNGEPRTINVIGAAAIVLAHESGIATQDVDITDDILSDLQILSTRYGKDSGAPTRFGAYIDFVSDAFALLPSRQTYVGRAVPITRHSWRKLRVFRIDTMDSVISKIKRFSAHDRRDIQFLIENAADEIDTAELIQRLDDLRMYVEDTFETLRMRLDRIIDYFNGNSDSL